MYKFNNSNLSFDEWIRLNDIETPQIIEASEIIADQAETIEQQEDKILELRGLLESFDFDSVDKELSLIAQMCTQTSRINESLTNITKILDNYKLRIEEV